jgi:hypothetical protein
MLLSEAGPSIALNTTQRCCVLNHKSSARFGICSYPHYTYLASVPTRVPSLC